MQAKYWALTPGKAMTLLTSDIVELATVEMMRAMPKLKKI